MRGITWSYDSILFWASNWRTQLGEYMVSTTWWHMPHKKSDYGSIAREISRPHSISSRRCKLATEFVRLDAVGFIFCGATRKTKFMQINLYHLSTWESAFVKLLLRYRSMCAKKWSKITSDGPKFTKIRKTVIWMI